MKRSQKQMFASFDIETDGPDPIHNSMLSIGVALFVSSKYDDITCINTFRINILPQTNAAPDPCCMRDFWSRFPTQWMSLQSDQVRPVVAMDNLSTWLTENTDTNSLRWVASPASVDWTFLKTYYSRYTSESKRFDIGFYCVCLDSMLRSYMIYKKLRNRTTFMRSLVPENVAYTHDALDDAIYQGWVYMRLRILLGRGITT
jgi:hypothetical protein